MVGLVSVCVMCMCLYQNQSLKSSKEILLACTDTFVQVVLKCMLLVLLFQYCMLASRTHANAI